MHVYMYSHTIYVSFRPHHGSDAAEDILHMYTLMIEEMKLFIDRKWKKKFFFFLV